MKTASNSGNLPTCFKEARQPCSWYTGLKLFKKKLLACLKTAGSTPWCSGQHPQF